MALRVLVKTNTQLRELLSLVRNIMMAIDGHLPKFRIQLYNARGNELNKNQDLNQISM